MLRRLVASFVLATVFASPAFAPAVSADDAGRGQPRIVCLGDSLTEGYGLAPEQGWPYLIEKALRAEKWPQAQVINAGVSGSTSASAVSRLKWQLRSPPDVLVLALGANDGLRGIAPEETRRNLAAAIDLAKSSGVKVLLAGMKMPPNYGQHYTHDFETTFADLARDRNVPLVPFLLEGVAAQADLNLSDGIHPNAKGYEVIAATILTHLRPLLEKGG